MAQAKRNPKLKQTPLLLRSAGLLCAASLLASSTAFALGNRGGATRTATVGGADKQATAAAARERGLANPTLPVGYTGQAVPAAGSGEGSSSMPTMPSGGMPGSESAPSYGGGPFQQRSGTDNTDAAPYENGEQGRNRGIWGKVEDHFGFGAAKGVGSAPGGPAVSGPFNEAFANCTKELGGSGGACKFQNWGIWGDAAHRARPSCHNNGTAIDVGPISCGGQTFKADSPQFKKVAVCLAQSSGEKFQVILNHLPRGHNIMNAPGHTGHMHVQLKGCKMVMGGGR